MYRKDNIMSKSNNYDIQYLEYKIKEAEQNNEPIAPYISREIEWLQKELEKFLKISEQNGKDINTDIEIAEIEIKQYAAMKQLAQKASLPTDEYDELIKKVQIRIFGEENLENFFGKNS